jgi:hypothetical protein
MADVIPLDEFERKAQREQETFKDRGDTRVCMAHGADFRSAMIQTTMVGVAPDEPTTGR